LRRDSSWILGAWLRRKRRAQRKQELIELRHQHRAALERKVCPRFSECLRAPASFAPLRAQRAAGAERHLSKEAERQARNDRLIDALVLEEPNWVQPDRVEEAIIHALDNPIRIDV